MHPKCCFLSSSPPPTWAWTPHSPRSSPARWKKIKDTGDDHAGHRESPQVHRFRTATTGSRSSSYAMDLCARIVATRWKQVKPSSAVRARPEAQPGHLATRRSADGQRSGPSTSNAARRHQQPRAPESGSPSPAPIRHRQPVLCRRSRRNLQDLSTTSRARPVVPTSGTTNIKRDPTSSARPEGSRPQHPSPPRTTPKHVHRWSRPAAPAAFVIDDLLLAGLVAPVRSVAEVTTPSFQPTRCAARALRHHATPHDSRSFKKVVDAAMTCRLSEAEAIAASYEAVVPSDRIPPNGINLNVPISGWHSEGDRQPPDSSGPAVY